MHELSYLVIPQVVQHAVCGNQDHIARLQLQLIYNSTLAGVGVLVWPRACQLEGHVEVVLLCLQVQQDTVWLSMAA